MGKSPQVILKEKTLVTATTNSSDTAVAIVGYARNGEINKPVLCTNLKEFKETFGGVPETAPWSTLAAYRAFNYCNKVYYVRVADESLAQKAKYVIRNAVEAKPASLTFNQEYSFPASVIKPNQDYAFNLVITKDGNSEEKKIYFHTPDGGDLEIDELAAEILKAFKPFYNYQDAKGKTITVPAAGTYYLPINIKDENSDEATTYLYAVYLTTTSTLNDIKVALNNAFNGDSISYVTYDGLSETQNPGATNKLYYKLGEAYDWEPVNEYEDLVLWENGNTIAPGAHTKYEAEGVERYYIYNGTEDLTIVVGEEEPTPTPNVNTDFEDVTVEWDVAEVIFSEQPDGETAASVINGVIAQIATEAKITGEFNFTYQNDKVVLFNGTNSSIAIRFNSGDDNVISNLWGTDVTASSSISGQVSNLIETDVVNGRLRIAEKIEGAEGGYVTHQLHFEGVSDSHSTFKNDLVSILNGFYDLVEAQYTIDDEDITGIPCTAESIDNRLVIETFDTGSNISLSATAFTETEQFKNFYDLALFTDCSYPEEMTTAIDGSDAISAHTQDNIYFIAKNYGTANAGSNGIVVEKSTTTDPLTNSETIKINIYFNGEVVETYNNVSLDPNEQNPDKIYFVKAINNSPDNGGSKLIEVKVDKRGTGLEIEFPDGVYTLGKGSLSEADDPDNFDYNPGNDGIPTSNPRKSGISLFTKVLSTDGDLANTEVYNYHILATPDNGSQVVQDKAMSLCESTGESFYLVDPPQGLTYQEVVKYEDGEGNFGRNSALSSSYGGIFHDWLMDYDDDNENYVWCPPSVFILELLLRDDKQYGCWYAPAGDTRGVLTAADYASSPSLSQRDYMYGDNHTVNPIVNFASRGLELYGQKTCLRKTTDPMSRIHIRRMAIYIKKLMKETLRGFIFEPNNASSWTRATSMIAQILEPIKQDNGIAQYAVQIDSSTMTEADIANNIMKGKVTIVPEGMIEIIEMNITFLNPGATITEA